MGIARTPSHIILATDFSARCDRAQDRAVQLALEWNASLTAVHALSDMGLTNDISLREAYRTAAMRNANLLREELACTEGLRSSVIVEDGAVEAVILEVARRERADLIVTGIASTGPLAQVSVGSAVIGLAPASAVPLLVVKKKVLDTNDRIAVASDLLPSSMPALTVGLRWFTLRRLALFHAFDPLYRGLVDEKPAYDDRTEAEAHEQCRKFAAEVAGEDVIADLDIILRRGDPITGLRILANERNVDLVIAGTHGRTGLLQVLLGSVASGILREVPADILIVPGQ